MVALSCQTRYDPASSLALFATCCYGSAISPTAAVGIVFGCILAVFMLSEKEAVQCGVAPIVEV
jgi:hypothetical protein